MPFMLKKFYTGRNNSVVEPHYFDAAPAPGENFDAAPALTLLYSKPKIL
jgi:hypothetical protein